MYDINSKHLKSFETKLLRAHMILALTTVEDL